MKTPEEAAKYTFGQRAASYTISAAHTDAQVLARVVELASPEPDWLVLDIATGTGHTALALAPHVASVVGIDLTPEMLGEARRLQLARRIANVEFQLADIHDLPFADETFALVTCRRAAHHFSKIERALQEMKRVLRSGGRVVIDDRSVPEDDFVDACMNELDRYHDSSHIRQYRLSEWEWMLAEAGFAIETIEGYTKHRPLTSLTDGVDEENVLKIHALLNRLSVAEREALNLREVNGEPYLNHWYVMISARKGSANLPGYIPFDLLPGLP
jgi:ubiquinone/menaquinone biosynthesis C-methylase UbiE